MGSRNPSRRDVLKTGGAVATVGVLGSLSGCSDLQGGEAETPDEEESPDQSGGGVTQDVPARANLVAEMDFQALLDDQPIRDAVNDALSEGVEDTEDVPSSVEGVFDRIEEETDVDPRLLNQTVLFGEGESDAETEYVGYIVYTAWSGDMIRTKIEDADTEDVETSSYGGRTVYEFEAEDEDGRLVVFDDGTVVLGNGGAVHDVIDVRNGDGDSISGELAQAWNATRSGYVQLAFDVDPEDLPDRDTEASSTVENVEYTYGSLYPDGDVRGLEFTVKTGSESDAEEATTLIEEGLARAKDEADDEEVRAFIDDTTVTTDGAAVTVRNEVHVDEITPVVEEFVRGFVTGFSGRGTGFGAGMAHA